MLTSLIAVLAVATSSQAVAVDYWHADPCASAVSISVAALPDHPVAGYVYNALSSWRPYPDGFRECAIVLNSRVSWTKAKVCTEVVHEYGHLTGHPHSADPDDVMYPVYSGPVRACSRRWRRYVLR